MADKEKNEVVDNKDESQETTKKSSGLMGYLMIGGGALVLIVAVSFATLMFLGDEATVEPQADEATEVAEVAETEESSIMDDSLFAEDDATILAKIQANLDFLDYQPTADEVAIDETGMSVEDSLANVNWLDAEKAALTEREKSVTSREKELARLDQEVTKKVIRLEQAESTRVQSLAKLYDGMDPRSVARLMANLDNETVVAILPRMKGKNASAVLSLLPPKRAAVLSKKMITIAGN